MSFLNQRMAGFRSLSALEAAALQTLGQHSHDSEKGHVLLREDEPADRTILVHSGWAMIYRDLADGRRQIMQFCLPGDLVDPCSLLARTRDFSIAAVSRLHYSYVSLDDVTRVIDEHPQLAIPLLWAEAREVYLLRRHLLSVGRMSALERMAALLLEFSERLSISGRPKVAAFELYADQQMLGDATGLSAIHVSRTLSTMERKQLISRSGRQQMTINREALHRIVPDLFEFRLRGD